MQQNPRYYYQKNFGKNRIAALCSDVYTQKTVSSFSLIVYVLYKNFREISYNRISSRSEHSKNSGKLLIAAPSVK